LFLYGTYKEDGTPNFGLFCWFSYCWDSELGVMACIGGEKLTKDRIHAAGVFSANLVSEALLPYADYYGSTEGYNPSKMKILADTVKGEVLDVPVLAGSPWVYELELTKTLPLDGSEVLICKIRNVIADERLVDKEISLPECVRISAPVIGMSGGYFNMKGEMLGVWGEPKKLLK